MYLATEKWWKLIKDPENFQLIKTLGWNCRNKVFMMKLIQIIWIQHLIRNISDKVVVFLYQKWMRYKIKKTKQKKFFNICEQGCKYYAFADTQQIWLEICNIYMQNNYQNLFNWSLAKMWCNIEQNGLLIRKFHNMFKHQIVSFFYIFITKIKT